MASSSRKQRIRRQRYLFLWGCLASLTGLIFYIFCRYKIPFPSQWLPNINSEKAKDIDKIRLFFSGISINLQVNFALGFFFMLLNPEKMDQVKLKKWRYWISKALVFVASLIWGLSTFWPAIGSNWSDILLLCLIITVINCCLIELLVQLMNQYGICNAFNLILFVEFLPFAWLKGEWNQQKFLELLGLLIITTFFIWITNLKWEVPVDTNTLYSQDSKILKKKSSKLGFKLSFSFMPLIYLSQFISFLFTLSIMRGKTVWTDWGSVSEQRKAALEKKSHKGLDTLGKESTFWTSLFVLNDGKRIFHLDNISKWWQGKWWIVIAALFFLIFLRWLTMWLQKSKMDWKPGEISKELQKNGVYINRIPPGRPTRNLISIIINKMVVFWNIIILVFNIIFDNLFSAALSFSNWFGGVNIGVDLVKQIRTKYRYIQTNK